jgi:cell division GTPase FtsZ
VKLSEFITSKNDLEFSLSFEDLDLICSYEGFAYIKTLKCENADKCLEELNFNFIPKGVLINFRLKEDFPLIEIEKVMSKIYDIADENADVIFATTIDNDLEGLEINLIFTGIEGV